jgi:hypothetical protein
MELAELRGMNLGNCLLTVSIEGIFQALTRQFPASSISVLKRRVVLPANGSERRLRGLDSDFQFMLKQDRNSM